MNRLISEVIEGLGIGYFKAANGGGVNYDFFAQTNHFSAEDVKSLYDGVEIFKRCNQCGPVLILDQTGKGDITVELCSTKSLYEPIEVHRPVFEAFRTLENIYFERTSNKSVDSDTCLIYIHGFSERHVNSEIKYVFKPLVKEYPNVDVLTVHMPYHMERAVKGQPYSGAYLFDSNPVTSIEGIRQGVHDVSQMVEYATDYYDKVIVAGFSLGGHITSFLATCDDRGDYYLMGQAGVDLPLTMAELSVCPGMYKRKNKQLKGSINALYAPLDLRNYKPIVDGNRVISVGGVYDRLVPYERVIGLRKHFDVEHNIDYTSGHIGMSFEATSILEPLKDLLLKADLVSQLDC